MTRRWPTTVLHGGGFQHEVGEACPHCHRVSRVVEDDGQAGGPYVVLEATTVHSYGCPYPRLGKRYGPCDCGAVAMWDRNREAMVAIVLAGRAL